MKKEIPLLTKSGGKLSDYKKAVAFRFWAHGHEGDDECYEFKTFKDAEIARQEYIDNTGEYDMVEPIIAVVYDKKMKDYREVVIDEKQ